MFWSYLINKDNPFISCNKIDQIIKRQNNFKKVGHVGTLDFNAFGLMLVLADYSNKLHQYCENFTKTYLVKLKFNYSSSTLDSSGDIIKHNSSSIDAKKIKLLFNSFPIDFTYQIPKLSAKKYLGKPLYFYHHKNIDTPVCQKTSTINTGKIIELNNNFLLFEVTVQSGTYLRSFCQYICNLITVKGYMSFLLRIGLDKWKLNQSNSITEFDQQKKINLIDHIKIPWFQINPDDAFKIKNGQKIKLNSTAALLILKLKNKPLAIYKNTGEHIFASKTNFTNYYD